MEVAILIDLVTRDGRSAVEVRQAQTLGGGYYAGAKQTVYSCAYSEPLGRTVALRRAQELCAEKGYAVVHYASVESERRAAWQ